MLVVIDRYKLLILMTVFSRGSMYAKVKSKKNTSKTNEIFKFKGHTDNSGVWL